MLTNYEKNFGKPGNFVAIKLNDGTYGYGRIRQMGQMSFYDLNTKDLISDLDLVKTKKIVFSLWVHKAARRKWKTIGFLPLMDELKKYSITFRQDITDYRKCWIMNEDGMEEEVSPEECIGLESMGVWEPHHVEERLLDYFNGRVNRIFELTKVKLSDD